MKKSDDFFQNILRLTNGKSQPNLHPLMMRVRQLDALAMSVKYFGYELARTLSDKLPKTPAQPPTFIGLCSKPSTQDDLASSWVATWCEALHVPVVFHRKLWEYCYVLQALFDHGALRCGARGLGFGCGHEPLPSYFASLGIDVLVTDLDPGEASARGWLSSAQHATDLGIAHKPHLVARDEFDKRCSLRYVDMNNIPDDLVGFDFCWSICSLEHLGSISRGMSFIENAMKTIKEGGVAVHTTEFNFMNDEETIDNWPTVLFQRQHFLEIERRLRDLGYDVAPLDFNVGSKPLDRFIDTPPWLHDQSDYIRSQWGTDSMHIKLSIDGFVCTCFGLIIKKSHPAA